MLRKAIMEALKMQVGAEKTGDNCYEIQPYWRGKLADAILEALKARGEYIDVTSAIIHKPIGPYWKGWVIRIPDEEVKDAG